MSALHQYYFIGTDEAGYGPNLGPLAVSATCWQMTAAPFSWKSLVKKDSTVSTPPTLPLEDSSPLLGKAVPKSISFQKTRPSSTPSLFDALDSEDSEDSALRPPLTKFPVWNASEKIQELNDHLAELCAPGGLFPVIDSKKLYHSGRLAPLERSFFIALLLWKHFQAFAPDSAPSAPSAPDSWTYQKISETLEFPEALEKTDDSSSASLRRHQNQEPSPPWEKDIDYPLPYAVDSSVYREWSDAAAQASKIFRENKIALLGIKSRRVHPSEFNRLLDQWGLKSELLARVTLELAFQFAEEINAQIDAATSGDFSPRVMILCDKLGGRNQYRETLHKIIPRISWEMIEESRPLSVYRGLLGGRLPIEIRFQAKGEANLPTALASIADKYLRELSMINFNRFFQKHSPPLRPTAGYPLDAKRFRDETEEIRRQLGIKDGDFWRKK